MTTVLHLLQSPFILLDNQRIDLSPHKPVFLLIYLAVRYEWVSRDELLGVFYPDSAEQEARKSLRVLINRVRALTWSKTLEIEPHRLRWQIPNDVQMLREAMGRKAWSDVLSLHQKPLLSTFSISLIPGFDAWVELEREALVSSWRKAALEQAAILNKAEKHFEAESLLRQVTQQDWLAEDVLQLYMEQAYLSGQRNLAIHAYESFKRRLKDELGLTPLEKTQHLRSMIQQSAPLISNQVRLVREVLVPLSVQQPPRLIAREQEQRILQQTQAPLTVIKGEPGAGKTRLLRDMFPQALYLRCLEGLINLPYASVLEFLRSHLAHLNPGPYQEDLARLIPELSKSPATPVLEPEVAKVRLLEGLAMSLESFRQPLIIDDIQWIDSASLELLIFLISRRKVRLYTTCRKSEESPALLKALNTLQAQNLLTQIPLNPFSPNDVKDLLADLIDTNEGPEKFSQWLYARSGGNVFFILETLKNLFENATLQGQQGNWHSHLDEITRDYSELDIPPRITGLIMRRLERLSPEAQRVIQAASVVRENFTPGLLSQLAGLSEWTTLEALEQAENSELIRNGTFVHDLFRQSIYASLSLHRQRHLHAQVANLLANPEPMVVADHWLLANEPEKALAYFFKALEIYKIRGWLEESKTLIERMLSLPMTSETHWVLEQHLSEVYVTLGRYAQAEPLIAKLLVTAPTPHLKARIFEQQTRILLHHGNISQAEDIAKAWEHLAREWSEEEKFELRYLQAEIATYQERSEEARNIQESLLALLPKTPSLNRIRVLTGLGVALDSLKQSKQALSLHYEAFEMAKTLGARQVQMDVMLNILFSALALKQVETVLPLAEETLALGEYNVSNSLRNNLAYAYASLERYEEARKHYEAITRSSTDPTLLCLAFSHLTRLHYQADRIEESKEALEQALNFLSLTDFPVAHIRVGIVTLLYGNEAQLLRVKPFLLGKHSSDPDLQREFEKALQKRGLGYPLA